ncbi:MAG: type II secretion system F family protein, partial [Armatimonadetes bacterium]|nr:type II secretion system F family protein [Armatimonadota bacterium]
EAESRMMATVKLRQQGLHIQRLEQESERPAQAQYSPLYPLHPVSARHLSDFYAQLAELLEAGVPIYEATESLKGRVDRRLEGVLAEVSPKLGEGEDASEILAKYPQIFPGHVRAMLKAGETSGNLDQICAAIAGQYEEEHDLRQKMRLPRMYYGLVIIVAILVPPFPWIIARGFSWYVDLFLTVLLPIIVGLLVLMQAGRVVAAIPRVKDLLDDVIYALPWLAPFGMRAARARILQTMYTMTRSGGDLPTSLNLAAQASGVRPMDAQLRIAAASIHGRVPVEQALADCKALTDREKAALSTAQQTGLYEDALRRLSEAATAERRAIINRILTGSLLSFTVFTAIPVAAAVFFAYRAYFEAIIERAEE